MNEEPKVIELLNDDDIESAFQARVRYHIAKALHTHMVDGPSKFSSKDFAKMGDFEILATTMDRYIIRSPLFVHNIVKEGYPHYIFILGDPSLLSSDDGFMFRKELPNPRQWRKVLQKCFPPQQLSEWMFLRTKAATKPKSDPKQIRTWEEDFTRFMHTYRYDIVDDTDTKIKKVKAKIAEFLGTAYAHKQGHKERKPSRTKAPESKKRCVSTFLRTKGPKQD